MDGYGFKATFGNEANSLFLRRSLQALIGSETPIEQVTFLPNELGRLTKDSRSGIYDLACTDANGHFFIVEMQLSEYPEFIQRMKFYSLYRFNTLVKKGLYTFEDLPRIYCVGILAVNIFPAIAAYHNMAVLRNRQGELIDDQTTFVTVELAKFTKPLAEVASDLDKLLYTMKTLHTVTDPGQYPQFWTEEWLQLAINELDKRAMTAEELLDYEMTLSANALAIKNEQKKMDQVRLEEKTKAVGKAILGGKLTVEEIAEYNEVSTDFVVEIKKLLDNNK
ncbi:MAG: Rpn family recombination-promoting nuclease/putative transposase [Ferruginibacter sp.]|nr:Rpn family recombination-promoting nuclease/putative transposase [Cytophagales bacterium]